MATVDIDLGSYKLGWHDSEDDYIFKPQKGLNEEIIREMSRIKDELIRFGVRAWCRGGVECGVVRCRRSCAVS